MTDIALTFDDAAGEFDLALEAGGLAGDDGLRTAIAISLFSDARARADDPLPQAGGDPRGWWGDAGNTDVADQIGSRLWLFERAKLSSGLTLQLRDVVREALRWLVDDGIASDLAVAVTIGAPEARFPTGKLDIAISLTRPSGPARQRFDFVWAGTMRSMIE